MKTTKPSCDDNNILREGGAQWHTSHVFASAILSTIKL